MAAIVVVVAKVIYVIAGVLLVGAIMLQEGKGGGLAALGGTRAETAFGSSNPVRRLTVVLALVFFVIAAGLSYYIGRAGSVGNIGIDPEKIKPAIPAPAYEERPEGAAPVEAPAEPADAEPAEDGPAEAAPAEAAPAEDAAPDAPDGEEAPAEAAPADAEGAAAGDAKAGEE